MSISGISGTSAFNTLFGLTGAKPVQGNGQDKSGVNGVTPQSMADAELEKLKQKSEKNLLDFAKLSEADKLRAKALAEKGASEEKLASMDSQARAELEESVRQKVADHVQQQTGKTLGGIANILV